MNPKTKLVISPKPWFQLFEKAEKSFVRGRFLHLALAGTIGKAGSELDRKYGDFRIRASLPSTARVRKEDRINACSTTSRLGARGGWRERGAEGVEGSGSLRIGACEVAARLETADEAAAMEQHGVGLPREAG